MLQFFAANPRYKRGSLSRSTADYERTVESFLDDRAFRLLRLRRARSEERFVLD